MREYGLQLSSIRNAITENYHDALRQVAEMGYKMAELYGGMGPGAQTLRSWMDEFGLRVSGTHTKAADLAPDMLSQTIADHHTLGCDTLIIPHYDISTDEKVDELVNLINTVQPVLEKEGITLAFHNHSREFWPNEAGQLTHFELQKRTDIKFELDTFWTFNAGYDPCEMMEKLADRLIAIHIKDGFKSKAVGAKAYGMPLGMGEAPVPAVYAKALAMKLPIIVESETQTPDGPTEARIGSVNLYAQKSKQAAKEKSRYAMEESPRATSRCFMFMYFLLPH